MQDVWDAVIIGGGPAGSSAATILRQRKRRVLVLEKDQFPRFHIGESMLTYSTPLFDELGVREKIENCGFMVKRGAQFLMCDGSRKVQFVFEQGYYTQYHQTFQVERSIFDDVLLRHAESLGAVVQERCVVNGYEVSQDHVRVDYRDDKGQQRSVLTRFLVDGSGLSNFTAVKEKLRDYYPGHQKVAIFAHFHGVRMESGERLGDILIVRRRNSWVWMIPLSETKTSVGLVLDKAAFKQGQKPQEMFDAVIASAPILRDRMQDAERVDELHVASDFSYSNRRLVSSRLMRIGDAAGFIDPIFSSGVLLALKSGVDAAKEIDTALTSQQSLTAGMRHYEKQTWKHIARYWEFIENFYTQPFTDLFFQPSGNLKMVDAINSVLAGRVPMSFAAWWRLRLFFLLVKLQKRFRIVGHVRIR